MMSRYVIIGSGVAGISAIESIRSQDAKGEISLIGDEAFGYYSRPGLAYYLTKELSEDSLLALKEHEFRMLNARHIQARVVHLDPKDHSLQLQNGKKLSYDRLLIATGAAAARLNCNGADLEGVFKLDNIYDARHIIKLTRKARSAVVVGGGITALEIVEGLLARGVQTHYFLRGDRYWSNVLDETESKIIQKRLQKEGVKVHFYTELDEILGKRNRVIGVRTKDGKQLGCNLVGIAVGIRPRIDLAQTSGILVDRGILVNEYMQSSAQDIFAAGDVAQVFDPFLNKHVIDSLWGPAREQGFTAGLNMVGISKPYYKRMAFNVTRLANLTTTIIGTVGRGEDKDLIGIARGDSETWRQLPDAIAAQSDFDTNRLRILIGKNTIIGAIVMGDQTLSQPLRHIITHQVDITPIRGKLLQPNVRLGDIIADFWTKRIQGHAKLPQQS
jgi:NAD(P)H-nitrite reductase large subunit